ncbi:MAG: cupredoxin domain-containing protein [Chloroflexi bacterium]|nr:cupredoxin domain-containing protein [Chloroflexota bacterium]
MLQRIVLAGIVLVIGLAACGGAAPNAKQAVSVQVQEFQFQPATLQVQAGKPVVLSLKNTGTVDHDWSILEIPTVGEARSSANPSGHSMEGMAQAPELHVAVAPGKTGNLEFTPSKAGTYAFYCTVAGHRESGMAGQLVVQ